MRERGRAMRWERRRIDLGFEEGDTVLEAAEFGSKGREAGMAARELGFEEGEAGREVVLRVSHRSGGFGGGAERG